MWHVIKYVILIISLVISVSLKEAGGQTQEDLILGGKFENCSAKKQFKLKVTNESAEGVFVRFQISWGDGTPEEAMTETQAAHDYMQVGRFDLVFTGFTQQGKEVSKHYTVVNDGGTPHLDIKAGGEGKFCVGGDIVFTLGGLQNNTSMTRYYIDYGDGNKKNFDGSEYEGQPEIQLTHRYVSSSCNNVGQGGWVIKIKAENACRDTFNMTAGPYVVAERVALEFNLPDKECTGNALDFVGMTGYAPHTCMAVDVKWDVRKKSESQWEEDVLVPYVFKEAGEYEVKAYAGVKDIDCTRGEVIKTIQIIERVKAVVSPEKSEICKGESLIFDASASAGEEKKYHWVVEKGDVSKVEFISGNNVEKPEVRFKEHGTYVLQMTVTNGCSVDSKEVTVVVKENPKIVEFKALPSLCPQLTFSLKGYITYDWTWEGNLRTPAWSVTGPEGGWEFLLGSENAEYPTLRFTKPGVYTLNVALTGVGCGDESALTASRQITIYDLAITGDIVHGALDVCENTDIVFTNNMDGVNLRTIWSVTKKDGSPANGIYSMTPEGGGKTTTFRFSQYGDYRISAALQAECSADSREFDVKIRRAPEIYFTEFPAVICPEDPFLPGNYIDFRPNGNDEVTFSWQISGSPEEVELEGADTRQPKITFKKWGDFTVTVTISNPTSCTSLSSTVSKVISVSNPKMDLHIVPDRNTICKGEVVTFQNTSSVGVEPTYYWGISPEGYRFETPGGESSREPAVRFDASGIYNVTAVVNGVCRPETLPFTIIVQEDPEVVLDEIPAMCPGVLKLTEEFVHYTWNDSWKSGAESTRRVVWKLLSKPEHADCTPPEDLEWNKFNPELKLLTPGEYILQVEVKSDADCKGSRLKASRKVTVYDPNLNVDIKPLVGGDVVKLSGNNEYQVVEGSPLSFVNNSRGVGLHCHWTVEPAENAVISDEDADAPSFTFTKFGTYRIHVDLTGSCNSASRDFVIQVKGVPKFDLKAIANRCNNWGEIDIRDYLDFQPEGSTNVVCNWEITPAVGFTLTEGTLSDMFYKVKFTAAGNYTLTLKAQAEYGGVQQVSQLVHVLRSEVTARAELSKSEGCTTDGFRVIALNKSEGDSLSYTWWVSPETGLDMSATDAQLTVDIGQAGDYRIYLKAGNICDEKTIDYPVRAYARPEVERLGGTDLGEQCEIGYIFRGEEHVGEIRTNNDELIFTRWSVSPQGAEWVKGDENSLRPDLSFEGEKVYRIRGQFKNHCKDTVNLEYTVKIDRFIPVILMKDTTVCAMSGSFRLHAEPEEGDWSMREPGLLTEEPGKNFYFDPNIDEKQAYRLIYERGNGTCLAKDSMTVRVNRLPVVDAGSDEEICLNEAARELKGVKPRSGEWAGPGVHGNKFYPGEHGDGVFRLEYRYTDVVTGCPNLDTIRMTVHPLPGTGFVTGPKHCVQAPALFIPEERGRGHRFEWMFGDGRDTVTMDTAVHVFTEPGNVKVTLTTVSVFGCRDTSEEKPVVVLALPPLADFMIDKEAGCGPLDVWVNVPQEVYADTNLRFQWIYGNGLQSSGLLPVPNPVRFLPMQEDTVYNIEFAVSNKCKTERKSREVLVYSLPKAGFKMMNKYECSPVNVPFVNTSTGTGNTYRWMFGDGQTTSEANPEHDYFAGNRAKDYVIILYAENRCAVDSIADTLTVKPNNIRALFSINKRRVCAGEEICFTNYSSDTSATFINQYWDFGDGGTDTLWDVCHSYQQAGIYPVSLFLDNGCGYAERKDSVTVNAIPEVKIASEEQLCEGTPFHFSMESNERLKTAEWHMGDDSIVRTQSPFSYVYNGAGIYEVWLQVRSATSTACPGEARRKIEVWSKPAVAILPLDTVACSPFLYHPEIIGEGYFKWDYGTGEELSSEDHYLYTNETDRILDYDITAYAETNRGCKGEYKGHIRLYNSPRVSFEKEIAYGRPEKVLFLNHSQGYTEFIWYLPDGTVVHSPEDQEIIFEEKGTYPVSLVAVNEYGCRDSVYVDHIAYMGGLYFPNTFIPHSSNEKVNNFRGIGMGLKEYHLEIFDLYGNKVWESTALEEGMPCEGWDGRNKNGEILPQGVYMWRAKAIFYSEDVWTGNNNPSGQKQTTQGTVLLLKK